MIKNKILNYGLISFQTSIFYCLEFILNLRISSILILVHFFKASASFLCPLKISESFKFLMFEVRNGTLAKLDYQQY